MKHSPILMFAILLLSSVALCSQATNPEPQSGSGTPKTPLGGTQAGNPASQPQTAPTPATPPPSVTPPAVPGKSDAQPQSTVGASGAQTGNSKSRQQPAIATPFAAAKSDVDPPSPKTEILDSSATSSGVLATDGHDPVLDPAPLPGGKTTMVGGIVASVDHIRNKMTVAVFHGGKWKVAFDERTHIFRNGAETTQLAIKKGERVYVDTMLDKKNHEILARNVRVGVVPMPADAEGLIVDLDSKRSHVTLRDRLGSDPVRFSVDHDTRIVHGSSPATWNDLKTGALVHVRFSPQSSNRGLAREIAIVAAPGSSFTFEGKITFLDMHRGLLGMQNLTDNKNYDIHFDPAHTEAKDGLGVGVQVRVVALFEGTQYTAQSINVSKSAEPEKENKEDKD